jgi:hypothetical protein
MDHILGPWNQDEGDGGDGSANGSENGGTNGGGGGDPVASRTNAQAPVSNFLLTYFPNQPSQVGVRHARDAKPCRRWPDAL